MKKVFCYILLLALLLSGCTNTGDAKEKMVPDPLTWENIEAIPIATENMREEELRQICLDFFRLQLTFQWTPAESFKYTISTYQEERSFEAGTVYAGLPYQGSRGSGNIYLAMEYYDPQTGILDNSGLTGQEFSNFLGNHCTSSPFWAWMRVVNSTTDYGNTKMTKSYGFLPVGDYTYDTVQWAEESRTQDVCKANGEQVMFEAYALTKMADGVFTFYSLGGNSHCRMVSQEPVVVRNGDGTINGEESYLFYLDQGSNLKDYTTADGAAVRLQGKVDEKITFAELYKTAYVPFTFAELIGTDPVEKAEVTLELPETLTAGEMVKGVISSNYAISYFQLTLVDEKGNVTYEKLVAAETINVREMFLARAFSTSEIETLLEASDQHVTVQVRVATGELLTAYEGTLTAGD